MRVWVTRDEKADGPLSSALRSVGLTVVLEPVLKRCVVDDAAGAICQLGPNDWLVLTSPFAVHAVAERPARVPQVAVVGEASHAAALARGFRVELVSSGGDAGSLFEELRTIATRGKVCYPRSSLAETPAPWPQIELISPVLYETHHRAFHRDVVQRVDVVAVASPSAVKAVGAVDLPFASIGPSTSTALRDLGIDPRVEATDRSFGSLAEAIAAQATDSCHHRA